MSEVLLECDNLTMVYQGQIILRNLNLSLNMGEILCLVGPSGGGKTTLLRCLAGLEYPTQGSIRLAGVDITADSAEKRPIIMMFQQPLLFPHLTVLDNVIYGLQVWGEPRHQREAQGYAMLDKIEMRQFATSYPYQLSGGQQQRVSLARALVMKPKVLLLDEPFSNLDPELRTTIRSWVREVLWNEGVTTLFVTHDREEAMFLGERVAVLIDGKLQQVGSPLEVYREPLNRAVAEFFSDGLVWGDMGFVLADKLRLDPVGRVPKQDFVEIIKGRITGRWARGGRLAYYVYLDQVEKELLLWSNLELQPGDLVDVSFEVKDISNLAQ